MSAELEQVLEQQVEEPVAAPEPAAAQEAPPEAPAKPEKEAPPEKSESLRDVITSAMKQHSEPEEGEEGEEPAVRVRDPLTGKFVKEPKAKEPKAPQVRAAPKATPGKAAAQVPAPAGAAAEPAPQKRDATRAPQSWRALEREQWEKVPPQVREWLGPVLQRREAEVNARLQRDSEAVRRAQAFDQLVAPYAQHIQARGADVNATVSDLLRTAHALGTGSDRDRAAIAANILRAYRVDLNLLADAIDEQGSAPGAAPQQRTVYDPRVDELQAELRRRDEEYTAYLRQQEEEEHQRLSRHYEDFGKTHEFLNEPGVRERMASIIRLKAQEGVDISDDEAYNMAVDLDSELRQVRQQREEAKRTASPGGPTRRAQEAARSLAPRSPVRDLDAVDATDLRATITAAMNKHVGRA